MGEFRLSDPWSGHDTGSEQHNESPRKIINALSVWWLYHGKIQNNLAKDFQTDFNSDF